MTAARRAARHLWAGALALATAAAVTACGNGAAAPTSQSPTTSTSPSSTSRGSVLAGATRSTDWQAQLGGTLSRAVAAADRRGGTASAAVWVEGWNEPIVRGDARRLGRLWSVSKVATAIAAAQLTGDRLSGPLYGAMTDAITRSDNCGQRTVVLGLERLAGSPGAAAQAFDGVMRQAGVSLRGQYQIGNVAADRDCIPYLRAHRGIFVNPLSPALQFGVLTWTIGGAIRFASMLAAGTYGKAGSTVLDLMRRPKRYALGPQARSDYTSPLDLPPSGGDYPARWRPAYKGGWGGSLLGSFLAEQIVTLRVAGRSVAIAAMFWPSAPAVSDDPGKGVAPRALEALSVEIRRRLQRLAG